MLSSLHTNDDIFWEDRYYSLKTDNLDNYANSDFPLINFEYGKHIAKLVGLNMETGPWLAGGMVRRIYSGHSTDGAADWDIWFANQQQYFSAKDQILKLHESLIIADTPNAITVGLQPKGRPGPPVKVQLIQKKFFANAHEVIADFDFSICQLLTDGYTILTGDTTTDDLASKTIRLCDPNFNVSVKGFFNRVLKYTAYGFSPSSELILQMQEITPDFTWGEANAY